MTLYDYISTNNPYEANNLLRSYGFRDSDSISTISSRLKMIVRNHKEEGLKEVSQLHPDIELLSAFVGGIETEDKFLNATGRTPDFADPNRYGQSNMDGFKESVVEPATNFANERIQDLKEIQKEALVELNRIKRDIEKQKEQRYKDRSRRQRPNLQNGIDLSTNTMLMLGIAFAIGYLIGKK
jgi:hypothetical protein